MSCLMSPFVLTTNPGYFKHIVAKKANLAPIAANKRTILISTLSKKTVNAALSDVHASLASPEAADVVVVGTGVLGLTIARDLVHGGSRVTLIGAAQDPTAASFAAGAMIDAFGELEEGNEFLGAEQLRLRVDAQRSYKTWLNLLEQETEASIFHREGIFIIGNSGGDHDVNKLANMKAALKEYKEPYELVSATDIEGLAPNTRFQPHNSLWLPGALSVDSHNLMQSLGSFAKQSPMICWHQNPCQSLERTSREWLVELANGEKISTPNLVLSAGAFSQALLGKGLWQDARLPNLHFGRGTSVIVSGLPALPHAIRTPNRALACGLHVVPRENGQWYVGSTNLFGTMLENARGPTCGELHTLLGQTSAELNTSLRNATIQHVGWGLRPVTSTGAPVFGSTKVDGLFIACGTHRQGIHVAPEVARFVSEEILQGTGPTHSFSPNSPKHDLKHEGGQRVDLALGVRSLLATALYPSGEMPYNRQREMEVFLETLLRMALEDKPSDKELQKKLQVLSESIDMSEQCVIRLFHEVLEKHLPERAPYVT